MTTVTLFELLTPIRHRRLSREEKTVKAFARQALLIGLDVRAAEEASLILGDLLRIGKPVNALDVLIAGIAVSNNASRIVTSDEDFMVIGEVADIKIQMI